MSDGSGQTAWSYHPNGWTNTERRTIGSVTKSISYQYTPNGSVCQTTYPSGQVLNSCEYDTAGRLIRLTGLSISNYIVQSPTFAPHGAVSSVNLSCPDYNCLWNRITVTNTYNKRLQPVNLKVGKAEKRGRKSGDRRDVSALEMEGALGCGNDRLAGTPSFLRSKGAS